MKLLLLEVALYWQAEFNLPPVVAKIHPTRFWTLAALVSCMEIAAALWVMGAIRPLSSLF